MHWVRFGLIALFITSFLGKLEARHSRWGRSGSLTFLMVDWIASLHSARRSRFLASQRGAALVHGSGF
jgi:hypothetical protein